MRGSCLLPFLLIGSFGAALALPWCGAVDYRQTFGPCNATTGRRSGTLQKRPGAMCQEASPAPQFEVNCECTIDDYLPHIAGCDAEAPNNSSFWPFWRQGTCSGGVQLPGTEIPVPCPCTNLAATYTGCIQNTSRFLMFYYEDYCTPPPLQPAPPPTKLPCDLRCGSGSFLGLNRQRCKTEDLASCPVGCQKCSSGAFSFAGDIYADLVQWPLEFDTGCEGGFYSADQCSSWELVEGSFWSGDQKRHNSLESWLITRALILNPEDAFLQFDYRVESEKTWNFYSQGWVGDGLILYLDGHKVPITNDSFVGGKMYSFQTSRRIPLPRAGDGYVSIKFAYRKDSDDTKYGDATWIKNIRISGTKPFVTSCALCPAGTFQDDPQANSCDPCPANTYSAAEGSRSCIPCNVDAEWAPAGAAACLAKTTCGDDEDFLPIKSCVDGNEVVSYTKVNPHCTTSTPKQDERSPGCEPCPAGTLADGGLVRRCVPCRAGMSAAPGATECEPCPPGTYGQRAMRYDGFERLGGVVGVGFYGELWSTSCEGLCAAEDSERGWALLPLRNGSDLVTVFNSGKGHGRNFLSSLTVNVSLNSSGSVAFHYQLAAGAPLGNATKMLLLFTRVSHGEEVSSELPVYPTDADHVVSFPLVAGEYTLRWDVEVTGAGGGRTPSCNLWAFEVVGAEQGTVVACEACPAGHFCPGAYALPMPCPRGQVSETGHAQCTPCDAGSVALPGTNECKPCGAGTLPAANADFCIPECSFEHASADSVWRYELTFLNRSLQSTPPSNCQWDSKSSECSWKYDYYVQLCSVGEAQPKNPRCSPYEDGPDFNHAFVCQSESERAQSWAIGANRTLIFGDTPWEWVVEFDGGKFCSSAKRRRRTHIKMTCDAELALDDATLTQAGEEPNCVYNFEFRGPQACPVCTPNSYTVEETSCVNGSRAIRYRPSVPCHAVGLEPTVQDCPVCDSITYEVCDANFQGWRRTVYVSNASCWTPGTQDGIVQVKLGRCAQVKVDEANRFTIAIALLVGLAATATVCGAVVGCKHRQLQRAYRTLQARRRGREMMAHTTPFLSSEAGDDIFGDDTEEEVPPPPAVPAREADTDLFPSPPENERHRAHLAP